MQRQRHPVQRAQRANLNDNNSDGRKCSPGKGVVWLNRPTDADAFAGEERISDDTIYGNPLPHLESIETPLCVVDDDNGGVVIHWNRGMTELTGLSKDQMLG